MTLLRVLTRMAAPGEREGRGITPARDKRTASGSVNIGLARLREALLLARATTPHDEDPEHTNQSQRDCEHGVPPRRALSQARCRPLSETRKALSVKAFLTKRGLQKG